jgi:hypothetical protein
MSTAKAIPRERESRRRRGNASPDQRQSAAMWSPFPPIAHYGVRVGLPYRRAGHSWNRPNMTIIVSDRKIPAAAGAT